MNKMFNKSTRFKQVCQLLLSLIVAFTSPDVISTSPKNFLKGRIDFTVLQLFEFLKDITCLSGKLKTEFTSPIAKSPSPGLSDMTFFACCITLPTWCSLKCVISVHNVEGNLVDYNPVKMKNPSTSLYISVVWVLCSSWTGSSFKFSSLFFSIFKILSNSLIVK